MAGPVAPASTPTQPLLQRLPGGCEVCRRWSAAALCTDCLAHFAPQRLRCTRCALPLATGGPLCGRCLHEPPPFERCTCVVDYAFPWDRIVARFKFDQQPELAATLAELLASTALAAATPLPAVLLPVPLSTQRLADRGYDQAWELARRLGRRLGVPARPRVLERRFDGRHQLGLSRRERLSNLRGAFAVPAALRSAIAGAHVGLVDDVMTTGATAAEAATALLDAGASRVDLWVFARTPSAAD